MSIVQRKFHYCKDPPTKCRIKQLYLEKYRRILGIQNSHARPSAGPDSLLVSGGQIEALLTVAKRNRRRVKTLTEVEEVGAQPIDSLLMRTNGFVKRGLLSFSETNKQDLQLKGHKRPHMWLSPFHSHYVQRFSQGGLINDDFSTIRVVKENSFLQSGRAQQSFFRESQPPRQRTERAKPKSASCNKRKSEYQERE